jgi:hypothetical protein
MKGGSNAASNLFTSCISCNSSRRYLPALEFASDFDVVDRIMMAVETPLPTYKERIRKCPASTVVEKATRRSSK